MELTKNIHYSQEIEAAILGQCLLEKLAFGRTYGLIETEMFYFDSHKTIYKAMKEMYDSSVPIDTLTVTDKIINEGTLTFYNYDTGAFITALLSHVVSTSHLEYHCHILKEKWQKREIMSLRNDSGNGDPREDITAINEKLKKILGSATKNDWSDMTELMFQLMQHQSDMANGVKTFVTTGFKTPDKMNGGFYNGQMIVLGARPSVGKSALMGQMALTMAKQGKKVGIISLEMNNTEIAARLSSIETDIPFSKIFRDIQNDEDLHRSFYDKISKDTINLPIFISDKTKVNVNEIKAKATKLKASKGCDVLMIDYLQLLDGTTDNKNYNREQEVSKMSRGLKLMAQELDIPIIVLCQLNRQVTARAYKDRFPKLSDLRESGAIEQDADIVMFIHRDYMSGFQVDEGGNSTEYQADLLATKWRNGSTFHLQLDFDPPKMRFSERSGFVPFNVETSYNDSNPF